jgi:hypothetical protein
MIIDQWKLKNAKCGRNFRNLRIVVISAAVLDSGAGARGFYHEGHRGHEEGGNKSWWESEG